ncbi:hypothetical protein [Limnobacter litoralis]|uniref:Uncharacterized protein n=1 Tax=Limnobacter litoralis TaxID=481366 RepID=A0ABQ5YV22_9BURK|nr:hypothetical protein [Limnobacter litoralis]GLR27285.1 hypothetical protein GCM10007875_23760 [Limnobacter litoralis]
MWVLYLEMVLALGVIVFIMVWTLRARIDHPVIEPESKQNDEASKSTDDAPSQ